VDAGNGLMAIKKLIYDDKKLTWAELKKALAADFEGEYEKVRKMCFDAPKHGNDIPEVNQLVRRVYNTNWEGFQKVGGNFLSKDIKSTPDCYTKSIHNYFGLVTGALPTGKKNHVALSDGSMSAMPGTDTNGPTALAVSGAKSIDATKYTSSHMNMKLPPDQLRNRKGRETLLNLVKTFMDLGGGHIQFSVLDTKTLKDAKLHPEKYRDLVVRVAGFCAFFTRLHPGVQDEIIARTEQEFGFC
jgi:pyruvate-formate lyase